MSKPLPCPVWGAALTQEDASPSWIWDGFLAPRNLTLLTSLWKSGKTTLLSLLLHRRARGGQLLGRAVQPGKTVVITEENTMLWSMRCRRADFGGNVCFFFRPFEGLPDLETWRRFIDHLLDLRGREGIDLVVIDPLAHFLPANESNSASLLKALSETQRLTEAGLAVWILHHPSKGEPKVGQAARGSGALPAFADILLEMRIPRGDVATRRRRLHGFARHEETPRSLLIELDAAGRDYRILDESEEENSHPLLKTLLRVIGESPNPLTRDEIRNAWPESPAPTGTVLWRWLTRAETLGLLTRHGAGSRGAPFRYAVALEEGPANESSELDKG